MVPKVHCFGSLFFLSAPSHKILPLPYIQWAVFRITLSDLPYRGSDDLLESIPSKATTWQSSRIVAFV